MGMRFITVTSLNSINPTDTKLCEITAAQVVAFFALL